MLGRDGAPIELRREVRFRPWGWLERLTGPGVTVTGAVTTVDTDAFLISMRIRATRPVRIRLRVFADDTVVDSLEGIQVHEGSNPMLPGAAHASYDRARQELVVTRLFGDQTIGSATASRCTGPGIRAALECCSTGSST